MHVKRKNARLRKNIIGSKVIRFSKKVGNDEKELADNYFWKSWLLDF